MSKNKKQKSLKKGPEDREDEALEEGPKNTRSYAKKKRFDQRARFNEFWTSARTKWG